MVSAIVFDIMLLLAPALQASSDVNYVVDPSRGGVHSAPACMLAAPMAALPAGLKEESSIRLHLETCIEVLQSHSAMGGVLALAGGREGLPFLIDLASLPPSLSFGGQLHTSGVRLQI